MAEGCFVRAIFGDKGILNVGAVLEEVKWTLQQPQPEPTLWYCYGRDNCDYLRSLGVSPIMLAEEPFCTFGTDDGTPPTGMGLIRRGSNIWRHKYPCVRDALDKYPACVWLDLDTVPIKPLPEDFWEERRKGPVIQSSLMHLNRRQAWWRPILNDKKYVPTGACVYFGSVAAVDAVIDEYANYPRVWDLIILAKVIDDMMGGWKGPEAYREAGYEFPTHTLNRWNQIFPPADSVFSTSWRRVGLTRYVQIAKARGERVPFV